MCLLFAQPGHWLEQVTRFGLLDPAQPHEPSWTRPLKKIERERERDLRFYGVFILRSVFLYCKNTNLVLKYLVFNKMLQIYIYLKKQKKKDVFMHTANTLKYFEHSS